MSDEESDAPAELWDRPTGSAAVMAGAVLLIAAVLAAVLWAGIEPVNYMGEVDESKVITKYWTGLAVCVGLSLGSALMLTGYIIRAIYFLPGDDKKRVR